MLYLVNDVVPVAVVAHAKQLVEAVRTRTDKLIPPTRVIPVTADPVNLARRRLQYHYYGGAVGIQGGRVRHDNIIMAAQWGYREVDARWEVITVHRSSKRLQKTLLKS